MSSTDTASTSSTADEAKAQASSLAGTTREEVASVAEEAKSQARNVMGDAMSMVDDQTRSQRDRLVETARSFSGDLEQMAQSGPEGIAGDVARQVADKVRSLGEHLDGREPSDLLEDVRDFARRRPGLFLLGALGAGVAFGRLARGAKDAQSSSSAPSVRTTQPSTFAASSAEPVHEPSPTPAYAPVHPGAGVPTSGVPTTGLAAETELTEQGSSRPHGDPLAPDGLTDTPLGDEAERRFQ